jgi:hypothetical protein
MGTWGYKPFENDTALDFIAEFEDRGKVAVEEALDAVLDNDAYVEAPDADSAIAAAAFVAAASGHSDWLENQSARNIFNNAVDIKNLVGLKPKASAALTRILAPESELHDLWKGAGSTDLEGFQDNVARLNADLQ